MFQKYMKSQSKKKHFKSYVNKLQEKIKNIGEFWIFNVKLQLEWDLFKIMQDLNAKMESCQKVPRPKMTNVMRCQDMNGIFLNKFSAQRSEIRPSLARFVL